MKVPHSLLLLLLFAIGCNKPFSKTSETAFAAPLKIEKTKTSVVFIAGFDEGNNTYYTNAKIHFEAKGMKVIDTLFSLDGIIDELNQNAYGQTAFDEIHIVSHSNAWLGMSLKTTDAGERITLRTLRNAKKDALISRVQQGIDGNTKIIMHSCGLGEHMALLQEIKATFTATTAPTKSTDAQMPTSATIKTNMPTIATAAAVTQNEPSAPTANTGATRTNEIIKTGTPMASIRPTLYATTFFNVFGGKFAPHYLAKPHYGFYPTAESPGPIQLAKEFKAAYPETHIDWLSALKTRRETSLGKPYTYKFNIPVDWEFSFKKTADIPKFKNTDALMDWIADSPEMAELLLALNIPMEKYRWRSETTGKKLHIKGKTTVLCVLAPLLQTNDSNEYMMPAIDDPQLYQIL